MGLEMVRVLYLRIFYVDGYPRANLSLLAIANILISV